MSRRDSIRNAKISHQDMKKLVAKINEIIRAAGLKIEEL